MKYQNQDDLMNSPFVSVIIPNYNHAKYLDDRIQSVLKQTYQNFEVIILDDCSTDNSVEVINKYKDNPHISSIVINDKNCGLTFKQWHKGFELAKGELIWIAESDDKCEKELLETLVSFFEKDSMCVLAYTESVFYKDDGTTQYFCVKTESEIMDGKEFIAERMAIGNAIVNASSAVFKKSVALNIDKQYIDFKGAGDRLFWIEIAELGKVGVDYHKLNYFRIHDNNSTKRNYYEGINQREDIIILNYIRKKKYITLSQYVNAKIAYSNLNIFSERLSPTLKKEIGKLWRVRQIEKIILFVCCLPDIIKFKLNQVKSLCNG